MIMIYRKYKICFLYGLLALFLFSACDSLGLDKSAKTRTILVYVAANNSLSGDAAYNYSQMLTGMKSVDARNNLLVYMRTPTAACLLKLSHSGNEVTRVDTVKTYSNNQNAANSSVMKSVMKDAFSAYPADNYGLILWSHGIGWVPSCLSGESSTTASSYGTRSVIVDGGGSSDNTYSMYINTLKNTLSSVGVHFDFIMSDACYMQDIETAYELKDVTDYVIGSPFEIASDGAPYQRVVPFLFADADNEEDYVKNIAKVYYTYYHSDEDPNGWSTGVCLSVVKCSELGKLASLTGTILASGSARADTLQANIKNDVSNIQYFDPIYYSDTHFSYDMEDAISRIADAASLSAWETQLAATVVWNGKEPYAYSELCKGDVTINKDCGLGMYIPVASSNATTTQWNTFYQTLDWYNDAGINVFF